MDPDTVQNDELQQNVSPEILSLAGEYLNKLGFSIRTVRFYTLAHPISRKSIKESFDILSKIFTKMESVPIHISDEKLFVFGNRLEQSNPKVIHIID
ncbi:MAG: hypothetical protein P9M03_10030, partial [Candidatus Theseobacter exili]|nr:hypothetical protein [Candidatus Theseobacter exili]